MASGRKTLFRGKFLIVEQDDKTQHELVRVSDSAAILIYIPEKEFVVFVSQHRPATISDENPQGLSLELPAGRFDYNVNPKQLLINEAKEEAGVTLSESDILLLNGGKPLYLSSGVLTERIFLAFAKVEVAAVSWPDKIFGISENEIIHRKFIPVSALRNMTFTHIVALALVNWFLNQNPVKSKYISAKKGGGKK